MTKLRVLLSALIALTLASSAYGAGDKAKPKSVDWHFGGIFGQYDKAAVLRGFQIYEEVCSACHSIEYFRFRNLEALDLSKDAVKAIAAKYEVKAEPNAEGEIFDDEGERLLRVALPKDGFPAPFDNALQGAAVHGVHPPDLSLLAKSRFGGANYIYSLLTGYVDTDDLSTEQQEAVGDLNYNKYYPGNVIAMAAPLDDETVEYVDGTEATLSQHAKDVTEFMMWVAEPKLDERKRLGWAVMIFMLIFTGLAYVAYRQIHVRVHESDKDGPWPLH